MYKLPFLFDKKQPFPYLKMITKGKRDYVSPHTKGLQKNVWWQFEKTIITKLLVAQFFFEDQWVGDGALSSVFPHLYHLSSPKNCPI